MNNKLKSLSIVTLALLALSACGGKGGESGTNTSSNDTQDTGTADTGTTTGDTGTSQDTSEDNPGTKTAKENALELMEAAQNTPSLTKKGAFSYSVYMPGEESYRATSTGAFEYSKDASGSPQLEWSLTDEGYDPQNHTVYYNSQESLEGYREDSGVLSQEDSYSLNEALMTDGVNFGDYIFNPSYEPMYGAYQAVSLLLTCATYGNGDDVWTNTVNGFRVNYGYAINDWMGQAYYFETLEVSFSQNNGAITGVTATSYELADGDYTVGDDGKFTHKALEELSVKDQGSIFTYTAETGTRETKTIQTLDDFRYDSFDLSYGGSVIANGSTVNASLSESVFGDISVSGISIVNGLPTTADPALENFTIEVTKDGEEVAGYHYFDTINCSFDLAISVAGTYGVSITSGKGVNKTFTLVVGEPTLSGFNFKEAVYSSVWEDYSLETLSSKAYVGDEIIICCTPNPSSCEAGYTLTVDNDATVTQMDIESNYETYSAYKFECTAVGTYTFTATSTEVEGVSSTFVLEVKPALTDADVFVGNYYCYDNWNGIMYSVSFTPATEGGLEGTAVITEYALDYTTYESAPTTSATYTYVVSEGVATLTFTSGEKVKDNVTVTRSGKKLSINYEDKYGEMDEDLISQEELDALAA